MSGKNKDGEHLIDFPGYEPGKRVPFPPSGAGDYLEGELKRQPPEKEGENYYEHYDPDPRTPQPANTTPGAPDLSDTATRLTDEEAKRLSPDVNLGGSYKNP